MKQRIDLSAEPREIGKHNSRALRRTKKVPAVVYGAIENANVCLNEGDIVKYNTRAYENALFSLKSTDSKANGKVVLIKAVDVHPVNRRPLHVDLFALDLSKPVRVHVEIRFDGKPIGLAEGGLLNIVNRQIEIECIPTEIPESLAVDVSNLGVGDAVHVSDMVVPAGVKIITATEITLAVVNVLDEEAATPAAASGEAAATAAPAAAGAKAAAAPAGGAKAAAAPKAGAAKAPDKGGAKK